MDRAATDIAVSVICVTYNQVGYIRDCLEGIVCQRTTFPIEVIVHDDASTDGTRQVVLEYARRYPQLIVPALEERNRYSQGVEGLENINLPPLRGRYLAYCEGDDYWTDPNKLQVQYDYMEAHPECTLCLHAVSVFDEELGRPRLDKRASGRERDLTPDEVIVAPWKLQYGTCSFFMRMTGEPMPPEFQGWGVGDWPFEIWQSLVGTVHYMPRPMATYRALAAGSWSLSMRDPEKDRAARRLMLEGLDRAERFANGAHAEAFAYARSSQRLSYCVAERDLAGLLFGEYRPDALRIGGMRAFYALVKCVLPTSVCRRLGRLKRLVGSWSVRARGAA